MTRHDLKGLALPVALVLAGGSGVWLNAIDRRGLAAAAVHVDLRTVQPAIDGPWDDLLPPAFSTGTSPHEQLAALILAIDAELEGLTAYLRRLDSRVAELESVLASAIANCSQGAPP